MCLAVFLLLPADTHAQSLFGDSGFSAAHGTYSTLPYEHVDPLSGNLLVVVTDLTLPGNAGLDLKITRSYNSKFHRDFEHGDASIDERTTVGVGWRLHFGRVLHTDSFDAGDTIIETPDGGSEPLYHTSAFPEGWITKGFVRYNRATSTALLPNGLVYVFGHVGEAGGPRGTVRYVTEIRDPFNNRLEFEYAGSLPGSVSRIRQHLSATQIREITFGYRPDGALGTLTYDGRQWQFEYDTAPGAPGELVLRRVRPPVGLPWEYEYGNSGAGPELTALLPPGGGRMDYGYATVTRRAGTLSQSSRVVTSRTTGGFRITGGPWTFSYGQGANQDQTIVDCPCGRTTYRFAGVGINGTFSAWNSGLLLERVVEENSVPLEREELTYQASEAISPDAIPGQSGVWSDPAVYVSLLTERRLTRGPQSWLTLLEYHSGLGNYNDFGRAWRVEERGDLTRFTERTFQYGFGPWIVDRTATESVRIGQEIASSSWTYDLSTGFLTEALETGFLTRFEPTAAGNVGALTNANNHRTTFTYQWGVLANTVTPRVTTSRAINPDGTVASDTVGALTTQYEYDLSFRLRVVRPPNTNPTIYEYDNVTSYFIREARGSSQTEQTLDGFGRVADAKNFVNVKTRVDRDACGRVTFSSNAYTAGTGTLGTHTTYDALHRPLTVTAADGGVTRYVYTGADVRVTDAENRVTEYDYSAFASPADARLVKVTDNKGVATQYQYEVLGNLTRVDGPGPGPARLWAYNGRGEVLTDTQPESGTTSYQHDPVGNLTRIERTVNGVSQVTTFAYDENERLTTRDAPGTNADLSLVYDAIGRIESQTIEGVITTFGFDNAGRPASRTDAIHPSLNFTSSYFYDTNDNLTEARYPSGRHITYEYDIENRLTNVRNNGAGFATGFTYDDGGRLGSYTTGAVTHTVGYDNAERVRRLTSGVGGSPAFDLTYGYDFVGQVRTVADGRPGMSQAYDYDELGRVRTANGTWGQIAWTYDDAGNRRTETRNGLTDYNYDGGTRRLTSTTGATPETFGWDTVGRLTSNTRGAVTTTYTYSPGNMLLSASRPGLTATYLYDADHLRVKRDVNGATAVSVRSFGGQVLGEYQIQCGTLVWTRDNVYAGSRILGAVKANLAQPTIAFEAASNAYAENAASQATFAVVLTTANGLPLPCPVSVTYQLVDGTATFNGIVGDYGEPRNGTITFQQGTPSGTRILTPLTIFNDGIDEPDQFFTVRLTGATGAQLGALTTHALWILDDDGPPQIQTEPFITPSEGAGNAEFVLTLSAASEHTVRVSYATTTETARDSGPYADYQPVSGVVEFTPGTTSRTVLVPLVNDGWAEPEESFRLPLTSPENATLAVTSPQGRIQDNERARVPINLSLPGHFFADGSGRPDEADFLQIGNRHAVDVTARLTFTRNDGSGVTRDLVIPAKRRVDLYLADPSLGIGNEDVSIAVQNHPDYTQYPLEAEHWVSSGPSFHSGRSSEGASPSEYVFFAEGSVNWLFEEWITVYNLSDGPVDILMAISTPNGFLTSPNPHLEVGPGRYKVRVRDLVGEGEFAIWMRAVGPDGQNKPIVAERTMSWNYLGPESHSTPGVPSGGTLAASYFAEGNNTNFHTYLCLLNPFPYAQQARIEYLHENNTLYTGFVDVPAWARATVPSPGWLPDGSFGMKVTSNSGGGGFVAERVMYQKSDFTVGTAGVGQKETGVYWVFTEGETGWWDTYFLLANPQGVEAHVWLSFTRTDGTWITQYYVHLPPHSRRTVRVNTDVPGMANQSFRTEVYSVGSPPTEYIVERATYWPGFGSSMLMTMPGQEWTASMSTVAADPSSQAVTSGLPTFSLGGRAVAPPPGLYRDLTEAVPGGPVERALAAQYEKQKQKEKEKKPKGTTGDTTATTESGVSTLTSGGGWFGGHVSGGRKR